MRSFAAEKYPTRPPALRNGAQGVIPETGIYWDPKGSGRGFTIEADGDTVTMGIYAFDFDGYPTWRLAVYPLAAAPITVRPTVFRGGQTLDGSYKAPTSAAAPSVLDDVTVSFESPCFAAISFNGTMSLERFGFGGTGCRSANTAAPSPRRMLPPDLAGDTLLTSAQVRVAAARVAFLTDHLGYHDQQFHSSYMYGKEIDSGRWWGLECGQSGFLHMERTDPDNDKLLSPGDVVWYEYEACTNAAFPAGSSWTVDGWFRSAFTHITGESATSMLSYYWLRNSSTAVGDIWFNGNVEVSGYVEYLFRTFKFQGYMIEGLERAPRLAVRSGIARRLGLEGFVQLKYEDLDMRLGLDGSTRLRANVRLLDPARPLLMEENFRLSNVPQQGVVVIDLQPERADGQQIQLRVNGPNTVDVQYRRGATVLSSQTVDWNTLILEGVRF